MNPAEAAAAFEVVHPLGGVDGKGEPFPTLYWLCDEALRRAVADLERCGWIKRLEEKARADAAFAAALAADHRRYAAARWAMLDKDQRAACEGRGWGAALRDRGVGGVADFTKVKCLHAHVAHALADRASDSEVVNAVGAWALARLGVRA
ncbi:MAG: DUF501 domain-containing protein [Planctomycetota bacterium]